MAAPAPTQVTIALAIRERYRDELGHDISPEQIQELFELWLEHKLDAAYKGWLGKYLTDPPVLV